MDALQPAPEPEFQDGVERSWQNDGMTKTGEVTNRPGTVLIKIGLGLAVVGVLFTIAVVSAGGNLVPIWLVLVGLVLAGIGFAQRVLAALERK